MAPGTSQDRWRRPLRAAARGGASHARTRSTVRTRTRLATVDLPEKLVALLYQATDKVGAEMSRGARDQRTVRTWHAKQRRQFTPKANFDNVHGSHSCGSLFHPARPGPAVPAWRP